MKKSLIFFWIIILTGAAFLFFNKLQPTTEPKVDTPQETEEETPSKSFTEYLAAGDKYFADANYKLAVRNYKLATQVSATSSKAFLKLGQAYQKNHQPAEALAALTTASTLNPNSLTIKLALVQSNLDLNQIAEAKELVWQLDRANFQVKYYTGLILVLYKEFDQAKEFFTAIVATDSTAPDEIKKNTQQILDRYQTFGYYSEAEKIFLQTMLAKTLTEIDQHYLAIPLLFDIISQKNNYRDAWIVLGYAYLNTDQLPETIDAFSQAEALDPEKPETLFFLGLAYQKSAKPDKAIYYIEKADNAGFEPKDEINLRLGQLYTDQKDYEKAAQKFEQIIDSNPDNIDAFVQLVSLYLDDLNQPEKALAASNKAIQYHNKDAISYNLKAWALTALGRADEAKKHLEKADSLGGSDLNSALIKEKITQLNLQITNPPLK